MRNKFVGLGEILWDNFPDGKQLGGAPANFAIHAQQLAPSLIESYIVSGIGNDNSGRDIETSLQQRLINKKYLSVIPDVATGSVDVACDRFGTPNYIINAPAAWDYIPNTNIELAKQCAAVCFGSLAQRHKISQTSIYNFLDHTPNNCLRIFDVNLRQQYYSKDIIECSLQRANILKLNDQELPIIAKLFLIDGKPQQQLKQLCKHYHLQLAILTRGQHGSLLITQQTSFEHPGITTAIIDTVGAGDAFTAAIAIGLLQAITLDKLNVYANRVAAFICANKGATPRLDNELLQSFNTK